MEVLHGAFILSGKNISGSHSEGSFDDADKEIQDQTETGETENETKRADLFRGV